MSSSDKNLKRQQASSHEGEHGVEAVPTVGEHCEVSVRTSNPVEITRRRFMGWMTVLINSVVGLAVVGPAIEFVIGPLMRKQQAGTWVPVADKTDIGSKTPLLVSYTVEVKDGYMSSEQSNSVFLRSEDGSVLALSPICPHLGCHVQFQTAKNEFVCPCHGGVYSINGDYVSGPAPRGMFHLDSKVDAGKVWIRKV